MAKISSWRFNTYILTFLKKEKIVVPAEKMTLINKTIEESITPNNTLSFTDKYKKLMRELSLSFLLFIISLNSYSQDSSRVVINPNGTTATVPISLLYECYSAVVERDSALYRETIRKETNTELKYQLLDCNLKNAKLKRKSNFFGGAVGIIVILNVLKLLL
jgi:hypothetical protein